MVYGQIHIDFRDAYAAHDAGPVDVELLIVRQEAAVRHAVRMAVRDGQALVGAHDRAGLQRLVVAQRIVDLLDGRRGGMPLLLLQVPEDLHLIVLVGPVGDVRIQKDDNADDGDHADQRGDLGKGPRPQDVIAFRYMMGDHSHSSHSSP